jgi:hypothetical protein
MEETVKEKSILPTYQNKQHLRHIFYALEIGRFGGV